MKKAFLVASLLFTCLIIGACSDKTEAPSTAPSPIAAAVSPTPAPTPAGPAVTETKTIENKDGSTTLVTMYSDGTKTELRTFKTGAILSVTRSTAADGSQTAFATMREGGKEFEVTDKNWVTKTMTASGSAIAGVVNKAAGGAEVAGLKAKKAVTTGAKQTGETAEQTAEEAKKKSKSFGEKVKEGTVATGKAAEKGAQEVGKGAKKVFEKIKP